MERSGKLILVIAIFFMGNIFAQEEEEVITKEEAIALALERNYGIEIAENDKTKRQIIMENLLNEFDIHHVRKSKSIVLSGGEITREFLIPAIYHRSQEEQEQTTI